MLNPLGDRGIVLNCDYSSLVSDTRLSQQHGLRYKNVEKNSYSYYLCFVVSFRTNNLTHLLKYSKRQECLYHLVKYLHDERELGYRKISHFFNSVNIKTIRNKRFSNSHVHSILKRKDQREDRITNERLKDYKVSTSRFELEFLQD